MCSAMAKFKTSGSVGTANPSNQNAHVRILSIDTNTNIAHCIDQIGARRQISIGWMLGKGVGPPKVGETWLVSTVFGGWVFAAQLNPTYDFLDDIEGEVSDLQTDMTAAQGDITTLQGDVATINTHDATQDAEITAITALTVPTGVVFPYIAATAPSGYLKCDGTAVSRTTYAALFAVIGVQYGAGDGSTTFNLPNMTNSFARGGTPGASGGASSHSHSFTGDAHNHGQPAHTHPLSVNGQAQITIGGGTVGGNLVGQAFTDSESTSGGITTGATSNHRTSSVALQGFTDFDGNQDVNNNVATGTVGTTSTLPPYVSFTYIIKT